MYSTACAESINSRLPLSSSVSEALQMGTEVFYSLKSLLKAQGHTTNVGDEGGFAPNFSSTKQSLDFLMKAIEATGLKAGDDVGLACDRAMVKSSQCFYVSHFDTYKAS